MADQAFHFTGTVLPSGTSTTVYVVDGRVTYEAVAGTDLVASDVWLVPGLVDAHCHVGLGEDGGQDEASQERQATADRDAGALTLRDCGVPVDTRWIDDRPDLPQILRHGRHIARPKRHTRGVGIEVEPSELVTAVEGEIARGDGWVKLVGDWIDRDLGDIAPLWPRAELEAAIARAHELGARVTAHCFGEDALPDLVGAGIDCIEHGTGMTPEVIALMADRQVALVPTLINIARFPGIAERGQKFPVYAEHMRALHRTVHERVRAAYEAGVPIYAGTDAGSEVAHGRIADEVAALHAAGLSASDALAAGSWAARAWLGVEDGLSEGSEASFVVYPADPQDLAVLQHPSHVVLRGRIFPA
ncbi:MAG: amidohydrolase family protein [Actinomycetota bacterium]|nr:amidohydrolase family protein [Actinomycetota bacterium]